MKPKTDVGGGVGHLELTCFILRNNISTANLTTSTTSTTTTTTTEKKTGNISLSKFENITITLAKRLRK